MGSREKRQARQRERERGSDQRVEAPVQPQREGALREQEQWRPGGPGAGFLAAATTAATWKGWATDGDGAADS